MRCPALQNVTLNLPRLGYRQDIGGLASPGRFWRRRPLMAFSQFSDIHMLDAESPAGGVP